MHERDEIAAAAARHWERMVQEGCGFTRPWLDLTPDLLRRYVAGELDPVPESLTCMYPARVLADVAGKDVLCLAAGGGQQSAVFGVLGARVTVVDLAPGQLEGDKKAAAHYGYPVTTLCADMRDLSGLENASFDLVYQPASMAYVPDVRPVYAGVARVLRVGGKYRVAFTNPATQFVDMDDWDGEGYRIHVPYAVKARQHEGTGVTEFRHYWRDIFGGLLDLGFSIQTVCEAPHHLRQDVEAAPGSWAHILSYVQWGLAIVARKERVAI